MQFDKLPPDGIGEGAFEKHQHITQTMKVCRGCQTPVRNDHTIGHTSIKNIIRIVIPTGRQTKHTHTVSLNPDRRDWAT